MPNELTDNERALLAREVAADSYDYTYSHDQLWPRTAFVAGWDAAMEYMAQEASEGIAHLDDDECCHFQD